MTGKGLHGHGRPDHQCAGTHACHHLCRLCPLYFVDPVHKAIGLSHSGWKGTVHRMGKVTLERMAEEAFGTRPEDVQAAIGPSICQDCYEVSEDVAQAFMDEFADHQDDQLVYRKDNGKYQLNLWRANELCSWRQVSVQSI